MDNKVQNFECLGKPIPEEDNVVLLTDLTYNTKKSYDKNQDDEGKKDDDKKNQKNDDQKNDDKKSGEKNKEKSVEEKLKEINMTKEKAEMILDALNNNEFQYIQQLKRKPSKKKDKNKPDW